MGDVGAGGGAVARSSGFLSGVTESILTVTVVMTVRECAQGQPIMYLLNGQRSIIAMKVLKKMKVN